MTCRDEPIYTIQYTNTVYKTFVEYKGARVIHFEHDVINIAAAKRHYDEMSHTKYRHSSVHLLIS